MTTTTDTRTAAEILPSVRHYIDVVFPVKDYQNTLFISSTKLTLSDEPAASVGANERNHC